MASTKILQEKQNVVEEITKIMGYTPAKIFVEMTRRDEKKGDAGRKASRKAKLVELYSKCKKEAEDLYKALLETPDEEFKRDKLYLYYTQMGKCMYTGKNIDLDDLMISNGKYDIDHIYPRHYVKDDNIDNNLVLVKKEKNAHKSDTFPIEESIRKDRKLFRLYSTNREGFTKSTIY